MRRREFITLIGSAIAGWPLAVNAQQPDGQRHIAVLMIYEEGNSQAQSWIAAFRQELGKLGWAEGHNIKSEYRWAGTNPKLVQQAAKDLVTLQPDLIISGGSPSTAALLQLTRTIPIVFANLVDPVGQGFAASLSRPGGNATGLVNLEPSMVGKWLELLKEVMPRLERVAVPFNPATSPYADSYLAYFKSTAPTFGVQVIAAPVADLDAFEIFAAAQAREPNTGLVPVPSGFMGGNIPEIAVMMARYRLPTVYFSRAYPEAGGLLSYGNNIADNYRRAATYVDRILKGERPNDLPIQFPVNFELVINRRAAKALSLEIPATLLATADEVIE